MSKQNFLIVGAGLSGATLAERLTHAGHKVLVIEKRDHIGGNCYDYIDPETKIRISKYGPHFFHTNDEEVWDYVNRFSRWVRYDHKTIAQIGNKYVPVPVNAETINTLFNLNLSCEEDVSDWLDEQIKTSLPEHLYNTLPANSEEIALSRVGRELYELIFKPYTIKQWAKEPAELEPSVLARIPVRSNYDGRYFNDRFQALPRYGYTSMFEAMLCDVEVRLNTAYEDLSPEELASFDHVIFTGRIDSYFKDSGLPPLEYRSLEFHVTRHMGQTGFVQRGPVVNTPSADIPYTRGVEYKWFPGATDAGPCYAGGSSNSIVIYETSCSAEGTHEPYYPVPSTANTALYEKYKALAETTKKNVHFVGRLASYKYFNMDQAIRAALDYFETNFALLS